MQFFACVTIRKTVSIVIAKKRWKIFKINNILEDLTSTVKVHFTCMKCITYTKFKNKEKYWEIWFLIYEFMPKDLSSSNNKFILFYIYVCVHRWNRLSKHAGIKGKKNPWMGQYQVLVPEILITKKSITYKISIFRFPRLICV